MAQRIINPDIVLTLTNDEFSAINGFLYECMNVSAEELAKRLQTSGLGLAMNQVQELNELWERIHLGK